ncbi:trace amine-associated receptor 6-like [Diadema setosum]|uniref:trace amine-associated receptor 6-like n=1 Tax=Diadema setosum TaxID=31175 RepID=UPI003B3A0C11
MGNESEFVSSTSATAENPEYLSVQWTISVISICVYSISTILAILGNVTNLIIVPKLKNQFSENTKLSFIVLAVTDLLVGLICASSGVTFSVLDLPEGLRLVITWACTAFVWTSMWVLTIASVDRYIAVTRPLRYHALFPRRRFAIMIFSIVVISFVNSGACLLHTRLSGECYPFSGICASTVAPSFAVYYFLPVSAECITTYVNVRLLLIARRHRRQIASRGQVAVSTAAAAEGGVPPSGLKGLKTIFVVTVAFYIAWLPSSFTSIFHLVLEVRISPILTIIIRYLIICNSWWNAIIYWIISPSYRRVAIRLLRQMIGRQEVLDFTSTENNVFSVESH